MELKDMILSTLSELDSKISKDVKVDDIIEVQEQKVENKTESFTDDEEKFLKHIKERLLVLFEGYQAPNNKNIESKIDLTINFLEYLLSLIDDRLDHISKK